MKTVRVEKSKLLNVILVNKAKHVAEYISARKIFIDDAIEKLQSMLDAARGHGKIIQSLGLIEPQCYVSEYDTVIKMLEMGVDEYIELTQQEFQQYVEDKWQWRNQFLASTSVYNNKLAH